MAVKLVLAMLIIGASMAGCSAPRSEGNQVGLDAPSRLAFVCSDPCAKEFAHIEGTRAADLDVTVDPNASERVAVLLTRTHCIKQAAPENGHCQINGASEGEVELWSSMDGGQSFVQGVLPPGGSLTTRIAFTSDGGLVLAAGLAGPDVAGNILLARSEDGGRTFGSPTLMSVSGAADQADLLTSGACNIGTLPGGVAFVGGYTPAGLVGLSTSSDSPQVLVPAFKCASATTTTYGFLHSEDGGRTWARSPDIVGGQSGGLIALASALDGQGWLFATAEVEDGRGIINLHRSPDLGQMWTTQAIFEDPTAPEDGWPNVYWPAVAASGDTIAVTFDEGGEGTTPAGFHNDTRRVSLSHDGGVTWSHTVVSSLPDMGTSAVAVANGRVWVSSNDYSTTDSVYSGYVAALDSDGRTGRFNVSMLSLVEPHELAAQRQYVYPDQVAIAAQGDGVLVVWPDSQGAQDGRPRASHLEVATPA